MPGRKAKVAIIFSLALLILQTKEPLAAAEKTPDTKPKYTRKKLSFGNLRKLNLAGGAGQYALNGIQLSRVLTDSIAMSTADQSIKVRATVLQSVLVALGQPVHDSDKPLLRQWRTEIPLVSDILKKHDSFGSVKPVAYDLLEPKDRKDLKLQEELVVLWSADPLKRRKVGDTTLMPPMSFPGQVIDVQYRGLKGGANQLIGKIILQILYIREKSKHFLLGGFVIVSKPNGDYEFYLVSMELLQRIIIEPDSGVPNGKVK